MLFSSPLLMLTRRKIAQTFCC